MKRRDCLALLAAGSATLPGCLDEVDSDDPASGRRTATDRPTPTTVHPDATTDEPTASPGTDDDTPTVGPDFVREAVVVPELVAPNTPDSFGVYGDRDEQYVIALLAADGAAPSADDVSLEAGGESFDVATTVGTRGWALFDYGPAYGPPDGPSGWVVARLPNPFETERAALTWPGGEHSLGEDVRRRLARPPAAFEVRSFDAPDSAAPDETVTATVTVENTADVDGTFVAAFNRAGPLTAYVPETGLRLPVDAGETATWEYEHSIDASAGGGGRRMNLHLHWRDASLTRTVSVSGPTATPE